MCCSEMMLVFLVLSCRDVYKRTCVAGGDLAIVESPIEPKWSSKGICGCLNKKTYEVVKPMIGVSY